MKTIDKPLSETAAKVLAVINSTAFATKGPHSEGQDLICINTLGKEFISEKVGISIKRLNNVITELLSLQYLERTSQTWYRVDHSRIETENNITEIKSSYKFY